MEKLSKYALIENMDITPSVKKLLINNGYILVKDLSNAKLDTVKSLFELSKLNGQYIGVNSFEYLKSVLHHDYGLTFLNEFEDLGINPNDAIVRISELNLNKGLKLILTSELGAYTFGDLLTLDYPKIMYARNMSSDYIIELKNFVHELGYMLKNEEPSTEEILKILKSNGLTLLEDIIDNEKICIFLYNNYIYTLEDLLNYGTDVYNLSGFEILKQNELSKKLKELNIILEDKKVSLVKTSLLIDRYRNENDLIKFRITKKQELLNKLNKLKNENYLLMHNEQELDTYLNEILGEAKDIIRYVKKSKNK